MTKVTVPVTFCFFLHFLAPCSAIFHGKHEKTWKSTRKATQKTVNLEHD